MNVIDNNERHSKDTTAYMVKILCKQKEELKICHINAQSLYNKIDEFRHIFENSGVNIICVSETWFYEYITDAMVSMNGYTLYRNDRKDGYGGVAIYVKRGIRCKIRSTSGLNPDDKVEHIFLESCAQGNKFLIGCVYRPNNNIDFTYFYEKLAEVTPLYNDVIIAGDFNSNLLSDSSLLVNMESYGLRPTNIHTPTHFTPTTSTLIDLFFVSNDSQILLYDQLSASCFSKHDLIFLSYNIPLQASINTIQFRNFKRIDMHTLEREFHNIDWSCIYQMLTTDEQLEFLENQVTDLFNLTVPLQTKVISSKEKPWFTAHIKNLIAVRNIAYSRWKRYKTSEIYNDYRVARKNVNKAIKKAKSSFYANKFENAANTRDTWKTIRDIGITNSKINMNENAGRDPNAINYELVNITMPQADHLFYNNIPVETAPERYFSFECVTQEDVLLSCLSIKSNATGVDSIHPKFFKLLIQKLLPIISHIFNKIITTSAYPKRWKQAKVIPIPKSSGEYRPIAILPYLSKAFEKLLHKQITQYLDANNLLSSKQSGFRAKHSCVTALIDVAEDLRKELDCGHTTLLVLLDHSKAFDTVDHTILIQKLQKFMHFSSTSTNLIRSYLHGREQYVEIDTSSTSNFLPVVRGVPQGSILGPLLFSIYANDLPDQLKYCTARMYADDIQLYLSNKYCNMEEKLNEDLARVSHWASVNGLSLNPRKSKCIPLHKRSHRITERPYIHINNQPIEIVKKAKNLGVTFNDTLTWSDHVTNICGRTYSMLRRLWSTQHCTPFSIRLLLAKTCLIPILTYACEIFSNCDANSRRKLNVTYNNITRYVFGLKTRGNYESIRAYSKKIYGVAFDDLMKIRTLIFLHKIITTREPNYLFCRLRFSRSGRTRNITQVKYHTLISNWQFFVTAIRLWNVIPLVIKETSNALLFKRRLLAYYSRQINL